MLLALDTATITASVAVYDLERETLLAELTWQARHRQTETLLPAARDLLAKVDLDPARITALAVTTGPGSFTGVRIAISAAKGMALGLPRPPQVIGIPTLSVTAAPWLAASEPGCDRLVCAYIQAGRGRFNWATFGSNDLLHRPTAQEHQAGRLEAFVAGLARLTQSVWLVGESTPALVERVADLPHVHAMDNACGLRRPGVLAWLAARHLARGNADSIQALQPLYLRNP